MIDYIIRRTEDVVVGFGDSACAKHTERVSDALGCYEVRAYPIDAPSYAHHHGYGDNVAKMVDTMVRMSRYHRDYYMKYATIMIVDRCTLKVVWRDSGFGIIARQ